MTACTTPPEAVTISVTDENDVTPVFTSGATGGEVENAPASNVVYTATVDDPDTAPVTFTIDGTDAALFTINSTTGEVTFNASPDFENPGDIGHDNHYEIDVHANDGANPEATQHVTIAVTDATGATITSGATGSEQENSPIANVVYTAVASPGDSVGANYLFAQRRRRRFIHDRYEYGRGNIQFLAGLRDTGRRRPRQQLSDHGPRH